jgi:hypothetical protein
VIVTSQKNMKVVVVFTLYVFFILSYNNVILLATALSNDDSEEAVDKFGTKEIFSTKPGGREWFLDADDPRSDGLFYITSNKNITRQNDGS